MARAVALIATLLVHAMIAMFLFGGWELPSFQGPTRANARHQAAAERSAIEAPPIAGKGPEVWPPIASATSSTAPLRTNVDARDEAVTRATAAGQAYERRRHEAIDRWRRQFYGENIAALMRLPVAQAWPALEQLLAGGDPVAADALLDLSGQCAEGSSQSRMDALATSMVSELDPVATAFVLGAMAEETRWMLANQEACAVAGLGSARLAQLAQHEVDPRSETAVAEALHAFDKVFRSDAQPGLDFPTPHAALLEALGADPASLSEDDWLTLLAAIDSDAIVAMSMSQCLDQGCPGMPVLPLPERRQLLEEAAGAGSVWAAATLAASLESDGDLVATYAWWLYTRWASATGCIPVSTTYELANAARQVQRLEPLLTAEQRRLAAFQAQQLLLRHASRMRALWNCPG